MKENPHSRQREGEQEIKKLYRTVFKSQLTNRLIFMSSQYPRHRHWQSWLRLLESPDPFIPYISTWKLLMLIWKEANAFPQKQVHAEKAKRRNKECSEALPTLQCEKARNSLHTHEWISLKILVQLSVIKYS